MAPSAPEDKTIKSAILELAHRRGVSKTFCPSEAARAVAPVRWRALMPAVREATAELADEGRIVVLQKGRVVEPRQAVGPIRLRLADPQ